jgi:hypothetical protein
MPVLVTLLSGSNRVSWSQSASAVSFAGLGLTVNADFGVRDDPEYFTTAEAKICRSMNQTRQPWDGARA